MAAPHAFAPTGRWVRSSDVNGHYPALKPGSLKSHARRNRLPDGSLPPGVRKEGRTLSYDSGLLESFAGRSRFMGISELARMLGVNEITVRAMADDGRLPSHRGRGARNARLIPREEALSRIGQLRRDLEVSPGVISARVQKGGRPTRRQLAAMLGRGRATRDKENLARREARKARLDAEDAKALQEGWLTVRYMKKVPGAPPAQTLARRAHAHESRHGAQPEWRRAARSGRSQYSLGYILRGIRKHAVSLPASLPAPAVRKRIAELSAKVAGLREERLCTLTGRQYRGAQPRPEGEIIAEINPLQIELNELSPPEERELTRTGSNMRIPY